MELKEIKGQQQIAVDAVLKQGKSVFLTGSAGTGKSFVLNYIIRKLDPNTTAITASTGIAAVPIGGTTLHSFAGIGLGNETAQELAEKVKKNKIAAGRWKKTRVLVVDEISMISATLLDKIEYVARIVRDSPRPWGGIQVVFCGDFLQLPPVKCEVYAFEAKCWNRSISCTIELTEVFRQADTEFVHMLQEMRVGKMSQSTRTRLEACEKTELKEINGIKPTILDCTRADVLDENKRQLERLPGKTVRFTAEESGQPTFVEQLEKNCQAPRNLALKIGAQVILLHNLDTKKGLCNGTRGIITDFKQNVSGTARFGGVKDDEDSKEEGTWLPVVYFENDETVMIEPHKWEIKSHGSVLATRRQIPLGLAWSLTIHKSQGMSLDRAEVRVGQVFSEGQLYVATSRLRALRGLKLVGFAPSALKTSAKVVEFYQNLNKKPANSPAELLMHKRPAPAREREEKKEVEPVSKRARLAEAAEKRLAKAGKDEKGVN